MDVAYDANLQAKNLIGIHRSHFENSDPYAARRRTEDTTPAGHPLQQQHPPQNKSAKSFDSEERAPSLQLLPHHEPQKRQPIRAEEHDQNDHNAPPTITDRAPQNQVREEMRDPRMLHSTAALRLTARHQQLSLNARRKAQRLAFSSTNVPNPNRTLRVNLSEKPEPSWNNYKVELSADKTDRFPIAVTSCSRDRTIVIRGDSGIVYFVSNETREDELAYCKWEINVKEGYFLAVRFESVFDECWKRKKPYIKVYEGRSGKTVCQYSCLYSILIYSSSNTISFKGWLTYVNVTLFHLYFTTLTRDGKETVQTFMTSSTTGYVTSPGFGGKASYANSLNTKYDLTVPSGHVVMVSFRVRFNYLNTGCVSDADRLVLHAVYNSTRRFLAWLCGAENIQPQLHDTSLYLEKLNRNSRYRMGRGFRMDFSFHSSSDAPVMLNSGLLNCSRPNYETFRQHVLCNTEADCAGGEDEGAHCPFSGPRCNGGVASGTKCFESFMNETFLTWEAADQECKRRGGLLAVLRSARDREAIQTIFDVGRWWMSGYVGLTRNPRIVPYMYRRTWLWGDHVVAYGANNTPDTRSERSITCTFVVPYSPHLPRPVDCQCRKLRRYFCEFRTEDGGNDPERSPSLATPPSVADTDAAPWSAYTMTQCPSGHVTFSFLSCESSNDCGVQKDLSTCTTLYPDSRNVTSQLGYLRPASSEDGSLRGQTRNSGVPWPGNALTRRTVPLTVFMFACPGSRSTVPYALVCDFVNHCRDGSDETFCYHGADCPELTCKNGQCFSGTGKCNDVLDCKDRSDEENCHRHVPVRLVVRPPPPGVVDFDGQGHFTQRPMQPSEPCPQTHFRCAGFEARCLPVYVRCNGVYDCPGREDEAVCERYTCPGFYRCRESRVCLHSQHVCDGWPQCPQGDDEPYCQLTCPPRCMCQGTAFVCHTTFSIHAFPQIRYLDASRSKMKPADLSRNTYLVWLSLASCGIDRLPRLTWPNLMHLDLSQNHLHVASLDKFYNLPNLKTLILADNPLASIANGSECLQYTDLKHLDLSKTMLREFDGDSLSCFGQITELNISHCPLSEITQGGFLATPYLTGIDLSGSPVSTFPRDVFKGLDRLTNVMAADYKLCCKAVLPVTFNENFCFAPQDEVSSCDHLLKSVLFRGSIWIFAVFAVIGNCGCFLVRLLAESKTSHTGFYVFVTNLTAADFLMGVYLVIVGGADEVYRGQYLWYEKTWRSSTVCAAAGFLSFLSSELSAVFICLITLDRFLVLTFPFSDVRFKRRSAAVTCALAWTVGILLASLPLFPWVPKWDFYGHTGICIALPITKGSFPGHRYAFGVMIILNFVFFVLIAAGQASIYWSVRINTMMSDTSRKTKDLVIARRLLSVAVSDFLCWFPIGFLGLMSSNGVPVSPDTRTAMAIFVLPFNSALNPFLYTFNVLMERRRKAREAQLIKMLEARILSQKAAGSLN